MNRSYLISVVPLFLTIVSGLILSSSVVVAKEPGLEPTNDNNAVVDKVNLYVPPSCTLSGVGMDSHTATISPGTYNSEVGTTTMKASCNDAEGFAIYAIGYTNDTDGDNTLASTTLASPTTIATGTATSGDSQWAMKLATDSNATYPIELQNGFGAFHNVPDDYTLVAKRTAATDVGAAATGSVLTSTYQVFIATTQTAGTYVGQVKYVMVHPSDREKPLKGCNPDAATIAEAKCMQDFIGENASTIASSMTLEQQYILKDGRDGKSYTVAKLADGNVWMTQNLDLDLDSSRTYTNFDTDIGYNTSTSSYETAAWRPSSSTATASNDTWIGSYTTPKSYDPGDLYWNGVTTSNDADWNNYRNSCTWNSTTRNYEDCDEALNPLSTYISSTGIVQHHLGNYYNWTAAVAMNDTSASNFAAGMWDLNQSICPVGWRLPKVMWVNVSDFVTLWEEYGYNNTIPWRFDDISSVWSNPLYLVPSGSYRGTIINVGNWGVFWASSFNVGGQYVNSGGAHYYTSGNSVTPDERDFDTDSGYLVRCLVRSRTQ